MKTKKLLTYAILTAIILLGFWFRLSGISTSQSLWSDEADIASDARDLAQGKDTFLNVIKRPGTNYQPANMLVMAGTIKLFGEDEFYLRLLYVIVGTFGIVAVYFTALSLSNVYGGLIAAFLFAFSQLNLANHTQAKPYVFIQLFLLLEIYFLAKLQKNNSWKTHILIIAINSLAVLFHTLGILIWIPYFIYLLSNKDLYKNKKLIFGVLLVFGFLAFIFRDIIAILFVGGIFPKNDFIYMKQLLVNRYGLIVLSALFGLYYVSKKYRSIGIGIALYSIVVLYLLFFKQYVHNLRYLVPFFGIIFMCYGIFWGWVNEKYNKKFGIWYLIFSILLLILSKQLVLTPQKYYSPNKDFYADVQIADYKTMFIKIKNKFQNYKNLTVFNDWSGTQKWYLQKKPNAIFTKNSINENNTNNSDYEFGKLSSFLREKNKYPQGLLIVEDWQSILPEDIKQYAKKNMKLEFQVKGLKVANGDDWPLELYSWGL